MSSDADILGMIAGVTVTILSASANHGGTISAPGFHVKQLDRVFEKVQIPVFGIGIRQTDLGGWQVRGETCKLVFSCQNTVFVFETVNFPPSSVNQKLSSAIHSARGSFNERRNREFYFFEAVTDAQAESSSN